jgi:hypothetical protein
VLDLVRLLGRRAVDPVDQRLAELDFLATAPRRLPRFVSAPDERRYRAGRFFNGAYA